MESVGSDSSGPDYAALTRALRGRDEVVVRMSLAEIDRLVDGLPPSAHKHQAWWANSRTARPHAHYWLDAHRQAKPDFNSGVVSFSRGGENRRGPNQRRRGAEQVANCPTCFMRLPTSGICGYCD